nr:hypothetical protein [Aminipila butyrica]
MNLSQENCLYVVVQFFTAVEKCSEERNIHYIILEFFGDRMMRSPFFVGWQQEKVRLKPHRDYGMRSLRREKDEDGS